MKDQLLELIEMYAAARVSSNLTLQQFAASKLQEFLTQVEITPQQISPSNTEQV
jgi:hypothetical protein